MLFSIILLFALAFDIGSVVLTLHFTTSAPNMTLPSTTFISLLPGSAKFGGRLVLEPFANASDFTCRYSNLLTSFLLSQSGSKNFLITASLDDLLSLARLGLNAAFIASSSGISITSPSSIENGLDMPLNFSK